MKYSFTTFEEKLVVILHCVYFSSDTSDSTTTDDIDTVIAKKRKVINIKKSKKEQKNCQMRSSRTGNGRQSSQDSSEYVKQTIESARAALISTSASSSERFVEAFVNFPN